MLLCFVIEKNTEKGPISHIWPCNIILYKKSHSHFSLNRNLCLQLFSLSNWLKLYDNFFPVFTVFMIATINGHNLLSPDRIFSLKRLWIFFPLVLKTFLFQSVSEDYLMKSSFITNRPLHHLTSQISSVQSYGEREICFINVFERKDINK
jgi:hypothetical protein